MRIRKRLASSYLPTTPPSLSDPHHHRPSDQPPHTPNQPSDHIMAIRRWVLSENDNTPEKMKNKQKEFETWKLMDQEKKSTSTINDDIRKIVSILNEEGSTNKIMQPSSHSAQGGFEGDSYNEVVPLMKRKRSCFRYPYNEAKIKSKTNNNFKEENGIFNMNDSPTKKNKRGNVIMEGSRCSRVNGRGWRCCHPTLVGYSLCEHHLGKGRARIVANQDGGGVVAAMGGGENRREQPAAAAVFTKKRTKVGVVKARSMSSLLGQI